MDRPSRVGGPTLAVIAREAGVSVPTASKVANGREDVSPETRRRVTEVLDRLGYVRRSRGREGRRPALVDLVVDRLDDPWSGEVLLGVEEAAHEAGLGVVVSAALTGTRGGRPGRGWLDRLGARGSAGVLFHLAQPSPTHCAWLTQHRIPYVVIDPVLPPPPGAPSVAASNWQGGVSATEHLIGLGHQRIAVIGGDRREPCGSDRIAGYRSAMAAAGLRVPPEYVRYGTVHDNPGHRQTAELLALPEPPTAVFACSDRLALGALRALREDGRSVPDDVSLVGFGDLPLARWSSPELTTVRQPLAEMAAAGLRLLLRLRAGDQPEEERTDLSTSVVVRQSTAPPACPPTGSALFRRAATTRDG